MSEKSTVSKKSAPSGNGRIDLARLRNIGVIAHIDAGKTTVTDRILFHAGRTHKLGSVDEGTTVTDWMEQERERGITIVAAAVTADWRDCVVNLIDTPGHIDFTAEVQRSLRVLDGAVVVFDAVHGVQPQSETVWRQSDRYHVPRICFVNKMDRVGADFARSVATIGERLGVVAASLQLPIGAEGGFAGVVDLLEMKALIWSRESGAPPKPGEVPENLRVAAEAARALLIEQIAEADDEVLGVYAAGEEPGAVLLRTALRRATLANRLFPVFCGTALRDVGVQPLLDGVVDYLPSPLDIGEVAGADPESGRAVALRPRDEDPAAALVFKISNDAYVGHLSYVRVYAGTVRAGMSLYNAGRQRKERVGRLLRMYANHREDVEAIHAGDIAAILGLGHTFTGDTLSEVGRPVVLESISFPEPVIRVTVEPKTAADQERMSDALRRLADEDPTFRLSMDEESGRVVIAGMGELHLDVLLERLRREYGVPVWKGRPWVAYQETITREVPAVEAEFSHQTGGRGQYALVVLALRPGERGTGIRFENAVGPKLIPAHFISAVERGARDGAQAGVLGNHQVTDMTIRLEGGSAHPVESTELAFRTAAAAALRDGMRQGEPALLEPLFRIEVLVPSEFTGGVLSQLVARRAEIQAVEHRPGGLEAIVGHIPLAETFGYVTELRSATQGRGLFTMEFDHYALVDPDRAKAILSGGAYL
jgi:elongation factor G